MALDWIVPSSRGDDAPLSAAAMRDALLRLDSLGLAAPLALETTTTKVLRSGANQLRVVHGPAIGAYIGAIIELKTTFKVLPQEPLAAWLLLVEAIPAGTDGTPVERNLVRNALVITWRAPNQKPESGNFIFRELRPLNIPLGARPDRLRLVGWVQDMRGRVLNAAQSVCPVPIGTD